MTTFGEIFLYLCSTSALFAADLGNVRAPVVEDFPCSKCHQTLGVTWKPEPKNLPVSHTRLTFRHMEGVSECRFCHSQTNPDELNLMDGKRIPYLEVATLCGQCHGERHRDWKSGIHGRATGNWLTGPKISDTCSHCHNAHSPEFAKYQAEPKRGRRAPTPTLEKSQ